LCGESFSSATSPCAYSTIGRSRLSLSFGSAP
jgi:hypothetical protein